MQSVSVGMATDLANSLGVTVTMSSTFSSTYTASKAIDGNPQIVIGQTMVGTDCAATRSTLNPWLRVDLRKEYFVSRVRVMPIGNRGNNLFVHVGNSLANNGNGNYKCGQAPYDSSTNYDATWRDVTCNPPTWGRYISLQRVVTSGILHVCEVAFDYGETMWSHGGTIIEA